MICFLSFLYSLSSPLRAIAFFFSYKLKSTPLSFSPPFPLLSHCWSISLFPCHFPKTSTIDDL